MMRTPLRSLPLLAALVLSVLAPALAPALAEERAIVVIDMQPQFETRFGYEKLPGNSKKAARVKAEIQRLIQEAIRSHFYVIFVEYEGFGSIDESLLKEVGGYDRTITIKKDTDGLFHRHNRMLSEIRSYVAVNDIQDVLICGANGGACVKESLRSAQSYGLGTWWKSDAIADFNTSSFTYPYRYPENEFQARPYPADLKVAPQAAVQEIHDEREEAYFFRHDLFGVFSFAKTKWLERHPGESLFLESTRNAALNVIENQELGLRDDVTCDDLVRRLKVAEISDLLGGLKAEGSQQSARRWKNRDGVSFQRVEWGWASVTLYEDKSGHCKVHHVNFQDTDYDWGLDACSNAILVATEAMVGVWFPDGAKTSLRLKDRENVLAQVEREISSKRWAWNAKGRLCSEVLPYMVQ